MSKQFRQVIESINILVKTGAIGSEDGRFFKKALSGVRHSLSVKNTQKAESQISDFCKRLLEKLRQVSTFNTLYKSLRKLGLLYGETIMNYGKAIKTIRAAKNILQKQLSKELDLDTSYLSRIEKGERVPSVDLLENIAKKLGVPFYLFTLLASDKEDLKGADKEEIAKISKALLQVLIENKK